MSQRLARKRDSEAKQVGISANNVAVDETKASDQVSLKSRASRQLLSQNQARSTFSKKLSDMASEARHDIGGGNGSGRGPIEAITSPKSSKAPIGMNTKSLEDMDRLYRTANSLFKANGYNPTASEAGS